MTTKTILITGISGIKIEACIQKFISNCKELKIKNPTNKPILIKFDHEFENLYHKLNPSVLRSGQVWKDIILQQSYPVLERLWNLTFETILQKTLQIRKVNPNQVIFINLHSCYYHNRTQEYISLANIVKLSKLKPSMIVTFIDDIYEIHHRLTLPGGIYHDESNPSHTQMILRLMRLLDWRAKETMMSRSIASNLEIENYVFAIKHPMDTFYNLVYENNKKVYLSHPITEVKRLENDNREEEAEKIMGEITDISSRLSSEFTTFLPTTIDEFRIKNQVSKGGNSKDYAASLTKRWEYELYEKPKDFLYAVSGFNDIDELWHENEVFEFDEQINHLLEALSDSISDQVTIRDYTLVEKSDMLVIYRPLFNGNASGGVREEFYYYTCLVNDTDRKALCFIYCPQKDINKYYVRQFEKKIQGEIKEERSLKCKGEAFESISPTECEQLLKSVHDESLLLDIFGMVLDNHKIQIVITNEKTPLGGNKIKEFKATFISELIKAFRSIDIYRQANITYVETKEITVEEFVVNISKHLKK